MGRPRGSRCGAAGYSLVALVIIITTLNVLVAAALPLWSQAIRREKEEELIFRGLQYAEAIRVFHARFQRYPTRLEELIEVKPRCIRQLWKDPMTEDGKWQLIFQGRESVPLSAQPGPGEAATNGRGGGGAARRPGLGGGLTGQLGGGFDKQGQSFGPIKGVYSRSDQKSIAVWSDRDQYDQWRFNSDLLSGEGRVVAPGGGVAVPQGTAGAPAGQTVLSVRWLGRPWRQGLNNQKSVGSEPVFRPGGANQGPSSTPGAPGFNPPPAQPPSPGKPGLSG